ncbi:peroxidase [Xylariales sp. PMI_506]|nr:peroxidase [Xylariales sp. PMI_506]
MKVSFISTIFTASPALAGFNTWSPPGPGDVRGPCPMLNTLANHAFLPHSGLNIDLETTIKALDTALNINATLSTFLFNNAITTTLDPNATSFSLNNLSNHNILEHDASLSRGDYYFGDDHTFNQTIFDETRSYWKGPIINVTEAAAARLARVETSIATNPTFSLSALGAEFSVGETAAYIIVLGNRDSVTVQKNLVEYLFENERLPTSIGWRRTNEPITEEQLVDIMQLIINVTNADAESATKMIRASSLHVNVRSLLEKYSGNQS